MNDCLEMLMEELGYPQTAAFKAESDPVAISYCDHNSHQPGEIYAFPFFLLITILLWK